ncbi:MAG: hypothetical protein AB1705_23570 [Verrucomicrobiota bacterium]
MNRRRFLYLAGASAGAISAWADSAVPRFRLARFVADVTPPVGSMLFGAKEAKEIVDGLEARGLVFLSDDKPIVLVSVDWIEIRNDAFDAWRNALAEAAGTTPDRVMLTCVHQHDAPLADLEAQRILEERKVNATLIDLEFHERTVRHVASCLKDSLTRQRAVTNIGIGQAKVGQVASNRRVVHPDGRIEHGRGSASGGNAFYREADDGLIDPWLKLITFWNGSTQLAGLHTYATHPMSYYGKGGVSCDFPGIARRRRHWDDPTCLQIYASGCSGNVTAGKYNDGSPDNRAVLADRLYRGMVAAQEATRIHPLKSLRWKSVPLRLEPRNSSGFTVADLEKKLREKTATPFSAFEFTKAALGLSWRKRADAGHKLDVPVLDLGPAQIILLPAESYVEFQLFAQEQRPASFVMVMGYGECAPGYIPTEQAWAENDSNLRDWCWVAPGAEAALKTAIAQAMKPQL